MATTDASGSDLKIDANMIVESKGERPPMKNIYARLMDPDDPISSAYARKRLTAEDKKKIKAGIVVTRDSSTYKPLGEGIDMALHYKQVEESDGFYVDALTTGNFCFGILARRFSPEDENDRYVKLAKLAVVTYNNKLNDKELKEEDTHGQLQFVKLVNVTAMSCSGNLNYLTFEAKNPGEDESRTYQAVVGERIVKGLNRGILVPEVLSFRPKPTPGSEKIWFWKKEY